KSPDNISIPAFLTCTEATKLKNPLRESQQLVDTIKKHLPQRLQEPFINDPVFKICHEVFGKNDRFCYGRNHKDWKEVHAAAVMLYQLGYPPRKSSDTSIGDSVNWEWIIFCAKSSGSNIAIVSRDPDYGCFYKDEGYLNDHLKREFSDRVSKHRRIAL